MAQVDINTADVRELMTLSAVSEELARRIVKFREVNGPFEKIEDLLKVEGFTQDILERNRANLVAVPPPPPPPESVDVVLKRTDGEAGSFAGHNVELTGTRTTEDTPTGVPFATNGAASDQGELTLEVPARATVLGDVTFRVSAPDGSILATHTEDGGSLPRKITITVDPKVFGTTQPNTDPTAGKPTRLRGQVIDDAGRRTAANLQVVIWGATEANPQDADFRALLVVTTDARGFFTGPYPVGEFSAAHATVGIDDDPVTVPIHLQDKEFPESVILVVDLPEETAKDEDCGCGSDTAAPRSPDSTDLARADGTFSADVGAGRCVDFTKPDRTLEEYSFSYVVRTTEPEIRGLTLDEPRKVPGRIVDKFLPGLLKDSAVIRALGDTTAETEGDDVRRNALVRASEATTTTATSAAARRGPPGRPQHRRRHPAIADPRPRSGHHRPAGQRRAALVARRPAPLPERLGGQGPRTAGADRRQPDRLGRRPDDLPGRDDRARPRAPVQAGVGRRRLLDGQPALQPAPRPRAEEAAGRRGLGAPRGHQP